MELDPRSRSTELNEHSGQDINKSAIGSALGGAHREAFTRAMRNVLSTELTEITFAQIVDGLPLPDASFDLWELPTQHPVYGHHKELCRGVLEETREIQRRVDIGELRLERKLINDYQASTPGSATFNTRLIEMTAVAVHEVAAQLYSMQISHHAGDWIAKWVPPEDDDFWTLYPDGAWPTLFRHYWYKDHEQYPSGVADVVGFWAEARILGGVVLFDRRDPASCPPAQPDSIWFHSNREDVPSRIYQLLDKQKQLLMDFLIAETPDHAVLPILGDVKNIRREDPEEPIENTGIYRHKWERKPLTLDDVDGRLGKHCLPDKFEYPMMGDWRRAVSRAERLHDRLIDEDLGREHESSESEEDWDLDMPWPIRGKGAQKRAP